MSLFDVQFCGSYSFVLHLARFKTVQNFCQDINFASFRGIQTYICFSNMYLKYCMIMISLSAYFNKMII